jgi:hypothetical protein
MIGDSMARPPNYKQDKKRREDAQKKRNEQKQTRLTDRKPATLPDSGPDPTAGGGTPKNS